MLKKLLSIIFIIGFSVSCIPTQTMELAQSALSAVKNNPGDVLKFAVPAVGTYAALKELHKKGIVTAKDSIECVGSAMVGGAVGWGILTGAEQAWRNPKAAGLAALGLGALWLVGRYGNYFLWDGRVIENISKKLRFKNDQPMDEEFENKIYNWRVCPNGRNEEDSKDYFSTSCALEQRTEDVDDVGIVKKLLGTYCKHGQGNDVLSAKIASEITELNGYINTVSQFIPGGRKKVENVLQDALNSREEGSSSNNITGDRDRLRNVDINRLEPNRLKFTKTECEATPYKIFIKSILDTRFMKGVNKAWMKLLTLYPVWAEEVERYFSGDKYKEPKLKERIAEWGDTYNVLDKIPSAKSVRLPSRGEAFVLCIDLMDRKERLKILQEIVNGNNSKRSELKRRKAH